MEANEAAAAAAAAAAPASGPTYIPNTSERRNERPAPGWEPRARGPTPRALLFDDVQEGEVGYGEYDCLRVLFLDDTEPSAVAAPSGDEKEDHPDATARREEALARLQAFMANAPTEDSFTPDVPALAALSPEQEAEKRELEEAIDMMRQRNKRVAMAALQQQLDEMVAPTPDTQRFLCHLSAEEVQGRVFDAFMKEMTEHEQYSATLAALRDRLLGEAGLARLVRAVLHSLQHNHRDASVGAALERAYSLLVNGDVQRGKTTVEVFVAMLVKWVNDNFADKLTCIIVTTMVSWAAHLTKNVSAAVNFADDADSDLEAERLQEELRRMELSAIGVSQADGGDVREVMSEGGCVILARTGQIVTVCGALARQNAQRIRQGSTPIVPILLLDEADTMIGSGLKPGDSRLFRPPFRYEAQLNALSGRDGYFVPELLERDRKNLFLSPLTVYVSATNGATFFKEVFDDRTVVADVISFKPADAREYVQAYRRYRLNGTDVTLDGEHTPRQATHFINDAAVAFVREQLQSANAVLQTNLCTPVNVTPGQKVTMYTCVEELVARLDAEGFDYPHGGVVLTMAGGNKPAPGKVGIRFLGSRKKIDSCRKELRAFYVERVGQDMQEVYTHISGVTEFSLPAPPSDEDSEMDVDEEAEEEEEEEEDVDAGDDDDGDEGGAPTVAPGGAAALPMREHQPVIHFCLAQLAPLLFAVEKECLASAEAHKHRSCFFPSPAGRSFGVEDGGKDARVGLGHLPLLLMVIKQLFQGMPILINGFTMLRRSLSLVAYDPRPRGDGSGAARGTVASVTAVLARVSDRACGPMVAQMVQRYCTTLTDYLEALGQDGVTILAPRRVFEIIEGARAMNRLFASLSTTEVRRIFMQLKTLNKHDDDTAALLEMYFSDRVLDMLRERPDGKATVEKAVEYLRAEQPLLPPNVGRVLNNVANNLAQAHMEGAPCSRDTKQRRGRRPCWGVAYRAEVLHELRARVDEHFATQSELLQHFSGRETVAVLTQGKYKNQHVKFETVIKSIFTLLYNVAQDAEGADKDSAAYIRRTYGLTASMSLRRTKNTMRLVNLAAGAAPGGAGPSAGGAASTHQNAAGASQKRAAPDSDRSPEEDEGGAAKVPREH